MSLLHRCFSTILKNQLLGLSVSETLVENELKVPSLIYVNSLLVIKNYISILLLTLVRKGAPVPPFFRHPPLDPVFPPFLKSLFLLSSFLFHPVLRYFRQSPPPSHNPLVSSIQPTNLSWFKQISKSLFYQFNCHFLSKSIFNLLNPFTNSLS